MTNLTLGDFPNLPEKREWDCMTMSNADYFGSLDDAKRLGFNEAKDLYDGLNVSLCINELHDLISLKLSQMCVIDDPDRLGVTKAMVLAEALAASAARVIKISQGAAEHRKDA